jgi:hypothetical protein
MKKSFYLFIALYLLSCSTEGDCFNLDTSVQLSVSDINGNDLLHPDTPNAFDAHGIRIIYAIPRGSQEVYYKNVGESVVFSIETSTNKRRINVLTYAPRTLFAKKNLVQSTAYIKWNTTTTDTLRCEIKKGDCYVRITKVWLNNTLVWWDGIGKRRSLEIVK